MSRAITAFLVLATTVCAATTVIPMSVEELTRSAQEVVEGQALDSWSAWNPQHTLIYTYTRFHVARALKGQNAGELIVKQLGGTAGGYTQKVSGLHQLQPGEAALLFLRHSAAGDGTEVVVGLMQGSFRIFHSTDGRMMASNGISAAHSTAASQRVLTSPLTLGEIESRVLRASQ